MAARDNVLFHASIASGTTAGTVTPLTLLYGVENVRQGYGTPKLKHIRAIYDGGYSGTSTGVRVSVKNSNWIDEAGLLAAQADAPISLNRDSYNFLRGRDKVLAPNTSWTITATVTTTTTAAADVYVLLEIEYSDVPGVNAENLAGSPVLKECKNASYTAAANVPVSLGSFDNLLQGVTYILAEASLTQDGAPTASGANFIILEGFSQQRGLTRIIPASCYGLADQIEGSVYLTKQTYNVLLLRSVSNSANAMTVGFEMIASTN